MLPYLGSRSLKDSRLALEEGRSNANNCIAFVHVKKSEIERKQETGSSEQEAGRNGTRSEGSLNPHSHVSDMFDQYETSESVLQGMISGAGILFVNGVGYDNDKRQGFLGEFKPHVFGRKDQGVNWRTV